MKPEGQSESIMDIESCLPPLCSSDASVTDYIKNLEQVEDQLLDFYNGNNNWIKKHTWVMKQAKHIEYQLITNSLPRIAGESIGEHHANDDPVLIGIGLGDFKSFG